MPAAAPRPPRQAPRRDRKRAPREIEDSYGEVGETALPVTGSDVAPLDALLEALPDALVLCDRYLAPLRAGAAAQWLLDKSGAWARHPAAAQAQAAVAAALDRGGVAILQFSAAGRRWEARAAPLPPDAHGTTTAAVVLVRSVDELDEQRRDAMLRRAHDLKAPLHAIEGFTKILLVETERRLAPKQRHMLELTAVEAGRMRALLERLLDLARTGGREEESPGAVPPQPIQTRVSAVLREVTQRLSGAAQAGRVRLELRVEQEAPVAMPADEVNTVFENLLTNALAAVPAGAEIVVKVELAAADSLRCIVQDTGPGLPPNTLERVFEPYFRLAHSGEGQHSGTGLGLAICRALVLARGGTVSAANRPGGGAAFTVILPVSQAATEVWPRLHLAPVQSHRALAGARAALDAYLPVPWRIVQWERGVFTVEVEADLSTVEAVAGQVASATTFACWRDQ